MCLICPLVTLWAPQNKPSIVGFYLHRLWVYQLLSEICSRMLISSHPYLSWNTSAHKSSQSFFLLHTLDKWIIVLIRGQMWTCSQNCIWTLWHTWQAGTPSKCCSCSTFTSYPQSFFAWGRNSYPPWCFLLLMYFHDHPALPWGSWLNVALCVTWYLLAPA